jgi:ectoine hydroxylase-related dioxygenase (phytanoyl-CoA dioxygenase family)
VVGQTTILADYPHASEVAQEVLVYDAGRLREAAVDEAGRERVEGELVRALTTGPGVVVFQGAFADLDVVDRTTAAFDAMIAHERAAGGQVSDHFAKAGANDRVWNALEKLAVRDPEAFVDYYANDILALVSTAWLGPAYQVTSQVNVVRPGARPRTRTATTTWGSCRTRSRRAIPRTFTCCPRSSRCRGRWRTRTCQ